MGATEKWNAKLTVKISRRMMRKLETEARRRSTNKSAIARQILARGLELVPDPHNRFLDDPAYYLDEDYWKDFWSAR